MKLLGKDDLKLYLNCGSELYMNPHLSLQKFYDNKIVLILNGLFQFKLSKFRLQKYFFHFYFVRSHLLQR